MYHATKCTHKYIDLQLHNSNIHVYMFYAQLLEILCITGVHVHIQYTYMSIELINSLVRRY